MNRFSYCPAGVVISCIYQRACHWPTSWKSLIYLTFKEHYLAQRQPVKEINLYVLIMYRTILSLCNFFVLKNRYNFKCSAVLTNRRRLSGFLDLNFVIYIWTDCTVKQKIIELGVPFYRRWVVNYTILVTMLIICTTMELL